jgi:hypothetical protein
MKAGVQPNQPPGVKIPKKDEKDGENEKGKGERGGAHDQGESYS